MGQYDYGYRRYDVGRLVLGFGLRQILPLVGRYSSKYPRCGSRGDHWWSDSLSLDEKSTPLEPHRVNDRQVDHFTAKNYPQGGLWTTLVQCFEHAIAAQAPQPIKTREVIFEDRGVHFILRCAESLARKAQGRQNIAEGSRAASTSSQTKPRLLNVATDPLMNSAWRAA